MRLTGRVVKLEARWTAAAPADDADVQLWARFFASAWKQRHFWRSNPREGLTDRVLAQPVYLDRVPSLTNISVR